MNNIINNHYGHWIVKELDAERTNATGRTYWFCQCDCGCGLIKSIRADELPQISIGGCEKIYSSKEKVCKHCGKTFFPQKNGNTRQYCFECVPKGMQLQGNILRKKMKEWALEYKGNKCSICGYSTNLAALEFHHINPEEKDFTLSSQNLSSNWEVIKKELDKCVLVCSNCHREIHNKIPVKSSKKDNLKLDEKIAANAKRVYCINTDEIFGSCQIAGRYFNISSPSHIKDVCNGKRNFCGTHPETGEKLKWKWADETAKNSAFKEKNIEQQKKQKEKLFIKIQCSTGECFNSIKEAAAWCDVSPNCISRALKNPNYTSGVHPITNKRLHWTKKGDDFIAD